MIRKIFSIVAVAFISQLLIGTSMFTKKCYSDPIYTNIPSAGIGKIAVQIECPLYPRYPEGAPVVVEVSTWFVNFVEFHRVNDTKQIGALTISYLWPGRMDAATGIQSEGEYDYGGPVSLSALKDVIRFASGLIPDTNGDYITELSTVPVLTENIGLFASSHSGVVATNVLAYFGDELRSVKYLVGRENPTRDEMYPLELGYFSGSSAEQNRVSNPFFNEETYLPDSVIVDYSTVGWYQAQGETYGRPFFATKGDIPQHILSHDKIPNVYNKRYYSRNITHALFNNGALTLENWPDYLATPSETDAFWPYRITVYNYPSIATHIPNLKIMLVFSRFDHVQSAVTKPHIHQAWDGFYHTCEFWVRMNPDRAYVQSVDPGYGLNFPDNNANEEPGNWVYIEDWGFPPDSRVRYNVWLASVAEMADRFYARDWSNNLDTVFFPVLINSPDTNIENILYSDYSHKNYRLYPNFPNPFNPETTIQLIINEKSVISLNVYDNRGRQIQNLSRGVHLPGRYQFTFDGKNLPSGNYYYQLKTHGSTVVKKMLLLK
ncbi:T9SS type A sorting domain-containing protein [bacterium]|nr:T9SS type A sorting domain-containing protein [bacterium]